MTYRDDSHDQQSTNNHDFFPGWAAGKDSSGRQILGASMCYMTNCKCQLFAGDTRNYCANPYCGHAFSTRKINSVNYTKHG